MSLDDLRKNLDNIDEKLVKLVAERQQTVNQISNLKRANHVPLRDYGREREVLQRARTNAENVGVSGEVAEELLSTLIRYSLTQQEQQRVSERRAGVGQRALVIGGAGKMGAWFSRFLYSQGYDVEIADPAATGSNIVTDWRNSTLDHDYVVVATPLGMTNAVLHDLAERHPRGIIFDLGSLKNPLSTGLRALQRANTRVTSIHPMFGPDAQLLSGRHVIFIDLGHTDALNCARELFAPTMAVQTVMSLDEHDRLIAYVLGLSHALNIAFMTALRNSGESAMRLTELSSTTFDAQFDMARRVVNENPQLYYEIQTLNAFGTESIEGLVRAVHLVRDAVVNQNANEFRHLMEQGLAYANHRGRSQ